MLAGLRQARRGPRWIELTRSAGPRRPFSHPCSVPEPLLVAKVRWRLDGFCVVAATNKCLAQSDKSRTEGEATKKRIGIVRRTIEQSLGCGVGQHEL